MWLKNHCFKVMKKLFVQFIQSDTADFLKQSESAQKTVQLSVLTKFSCELQIKKKKTLVSTTKLNWVLEICEHPSFKQFWYRWICSIWKPSIFLSKLHELLCVFWWISPEKQFSCLQFEKIKHSVIYIEKKQTTKLSAEKKFTIERNISSIVCKFS